MLSCPTFKLFMKKSSDFQRAAAAPNLPNRTGSFILYCLRHFQGWMLLMIIMETGQAIGHIMVPYAIKTLMDSVAKLTQTTDLQSLHAPFLLLLGLTIGEIIFSRASGAILVSVTLKYANAPPIIYIPICNTMRHIILVNTFQGRWRIVLVIRQ